MFCDAYPLTTWLAYLSGQLDQDTVQALEKHLDGCPSCLAELLEINRLQARTRTLSPSRGIVDTFTLIVHQAKEAFHTLVGSLTPTPLPATRGSSSTQWHYTSPLLGFSLTITPQDTSFLLSLTGDLPSLTLTKDTPLFEGRVEHELTLMLDPGTYTLTTDQGQLTFTLEP